MFATNSYRPSSARTHWKLCAFTGMIWRMSGRSWGREFWRWLWLEKLQVDQWFGHQAERKLAGFMQASDRVLVLRQQDAD